MQNSQPFIVTVAQPAPAHQTSIGEVVVGALVFTGVLVLAALVLGAILGGLLSLWRRAHPSDDNREMSISALTADENQRRSSQVQ